jgi:decaprenyl-phosphate phosphoribosyltransferase
MQMGWGRTTSAPAQVSTRAQHIVMAIRPYLRLVKFRYHISFVGVAFGALLFSSPPSLSLLKSLAVLYFSFNVLLYGGLYTLNDVADVHSDQNHPRKRMRPIPSGSISVRAALVFAVSMIVAGMVCAYTLLSATFALTFVLFIGLNAAYSMVGRNIPYLDLVVNSMTHPLRYSMGVQLTGHQTPLLHLAAFSVLALGLVCSRRLIEMGFPGWEARHTLRHYSRRKLIAVQWAALGVLLALFAYGGFSSKAFFLAIIGTLLVFLIVIPKSGFANRLLAAIWVR